MIHAKLEARLWGLSGLSRRSFSEDGSAASAKKMMWRSALSAVQNKREEK
jgi:hypothetical protein